MRIEIVLGDITFEGADAIVLTTEWNAFRALNFDRIRKAMKEPNLIDLRNVYDPHRMKAEGFTYISVGRTADARGGELVQ